MPAQLQRLCDYLEKEYRVSATRSCRIVKLSRDCRWKSYVEPEQAAAVRQRIKELAQIHPAYGYLRIHPVLMREGWTASLGSVRRMYFEEGLSIRKTRHRRRVSHSRRVGRPIPSGPNEVWSMDFMHGQMSGRRAFMLLNVIDTFTRECLAMEVGKSLRATNVVDALNRILRTHPAPKVICVDNAMQFASKAMDLWAASNGVTLRFSRPATPTDNIMIESFNARARVECLNLHYFRSLDEVQRTVDLWRADYNEVRPHSALGNLTPLEYAASFANAEPAATYGGLSIHRDIETAESDH